MVSQVLDKVEHLDKLAERINEQHRACGLALNSALDHALEVGRLLDEVKTALPHKEYGPWVEANFAGSVRTARAYRRLWVNREEIEAKRQSSATLSIAGALNALKVLEPPRAPDPALGVPKPPEGVYPDPAVQKGLEEEREFYAALERLNREGLAELRAAERASCAA